MHNLLELTASESFLERCLAPVVADKEEDILCSVLKLGIYFKILWYFPSRLDINWDTLASARGIVAQDIVLTFVPTNSKN